MSKISDYQKVLEEKPTTIIPYKLRRLYKMRDPYPVLVARNWARDMAAVECLLFTLSLFALASLRVKSNNNADDYLPRENGDDHILVGGVDITGGVTLSPQVNY